MKSADNKEAKLSFWASHLTTVVSVTVVLLLVGVIAVSCRVAQVESDRLKERLEVTLIMADSIPGTAADSLAGHLASQPYCAGVRVVSKEEALKNWNRETGEDLSMLFGANPLSEEITVNIRSGYGNKPALARIAGELESLHGVEAVALPDVGMVEAIDANISKTAIVLGCVAILMLLLSIVLINNTVHLAIYARRFTIHTMQLVGAADSFILRPIVAGNASAGLIAGVAASLLLSGAVVAMPRSGLPDIAVYVGWESIALICLGLVALGISLCVIASLISATVFLRKDYDKLFR